jgi:hypothetical protein
MKEKDLEGIVCKYPDLIEEGLTFKGRQVHLYGKIIDIMFEDKFKQKLIVELKIGAIDRKHIGQVMEYEGNVLSEEEPTARIMLVGNRVPPSLQKALDHHGIEWKEYPISAIKQYLIDKGDSEYLDLLNEKHDEKYVNKMMDNGIKKSIKIKASSITFDKSSLESLWDQSHSFGKEMKSLKFLQFHLEFCKKLTYKILTLGDSIKIKVNPRQFSFDDGSGLGPFFNIELGQSKIAMAPLRLTPKDLTAMGISFRDVTGKTYRMGGLVRVDLSSYDESDLSKAFELAKRSFEVKKKVGPGAFFKDFKKK